MKKSIKIFSAVLAIVALFSLVSCGNSDTKTNSDTKSKSAGATNTPAATPAKVSEKVEVTGELSTTTSGNVQFTMSDGQTFVVKCQPEYAPDSVENFLGLVNSGFYDGLTFHRILNDFVAQGGDPSGNGTGGSPDNVKGEFSGNGFDQNTLTHKRGSVAMARSSAPDSASSQFYICYTDLPSLDGNYAVFGEVISGMETIDSFLTMPRDNSGMPSTPITIVSATILPK